jgi:hypothetical protein
MKPLLPTEILPIGEFRKVRDRRESELLASKAVRRVLLGDAMLLCFENRLSVWWQVQEMCRVENIEAPASVQHELDTYNALLPTANELSATLLIGYTDVVERDRQLRALVGLQNHLYLEVEGTRIQARLDQEQFNAERISSVQFVRYPLDPAQRAAFLDFSRPAVFGVDHPAATWRTPLNASTRGALVEDLQG